MGLRRLSLGLVCAVLGGMALAASASACSCAPLPPEESLQEADAALVGRLVEVVPRGRFRADYRYEVVSVYRGRKKIEPGQILTVRSARRAAACALPRRLEHDYGLFLGRSAGHWVGGICGVVEPRRLSQAARHASPPHRRAPAQSPAGCTSS